MRFGDMRMLRRFFPRRVCDDLTSMRRVMVSFSGGVDSSVVLALMAGVFSSDSLFAVTFDSFLNLEEELDRGRAMCEELGIEHIVLSGPETEAPEVMNNGPRRCAVCKRLRLESLVEKAKDLGADRILDGTNADDLEDSSRLGSKVLKDFDMVYSPLAEAGLSKDEVRKIGRELGISWSDEVATACLATRFPQKMLLVPKDAVRAGQAERALGRAGIDARLRVIRDAVCLEFRKREDINTFVLAKGEETIRSILRNYGYDRIMIDLDGYMSGRAWLPAK